MQGSMNKENNLGTTLAGMAVAVSVIAIMAVIAFPSFNSSDKYQLDRAINEVVIAIRFAQSEAKRTGELYGIDIDRATKQVTVYKVNTVTNPVSHEFIVNHPVTKKKYDFNIVSDLSLPNIVITNSVDPFLYKDTVRRKSLLFDKTGTPVWFDANTSKAIHLSNAGIGLSLGAYTQSVSVYPYSGRVTF